MKIYMKFDYYTDRENLEYALRGAEYLCAIQELDNKLRDMIEYNEEEADRLQAQYWRDTLHEIINQYDFTIWR